MGPGSGLRNRHRQLHPFFTGDATDRHGQTQAPATKTPDPGADGWASERATIGRGAALLGLHAL